MKELISKARIIKTAHSNSFRHGEEFFYFYEKHNLDFQKWDVDKF